MDAGFQHLAEIVRRRSGIALHEEKTPSIARRLEPVARVFGFKDSAGLLAELEHPHEELALAVTEAMTTQDTCFFRDEAVFAHLGAAIIPALVATRAEKKRLRVWSAGCATGQEAYSLAMLLEEAQLASSGWTIDLIATDISSEAVARTRDGIYSAHEIERGLSAARRARFFAAEGDAWRASERLRRGIACRAFNLLDHFGWLGEIDVIFCRNVLMYLAPEERSGILEKLHYTMAGDGCLVLGNAETSTASTMPFKPVPGVRGIHVRRSLQYVARIPA